VNTKDVRVVAVQPSTFTNVTREAREALIPTGRLRAGINLGNELFTTRDAISGTLRGVSVDLMGALASRLDAPLDLVVYPQPGDVVDAADKELWDVAILAIEPARAERISFSSPITRIEATLVVHRNCIDTTPDQFDKPGLRIAAMDKGGYELYLTRTLQHATLVRTATFAASLEAFNEGRADAVAGLTPTLRASMDRMPGGRLLEGGFCTVLHGFGVPRARQYATKYLNAFVNDLNANSFIEKLIKRHQVDDLHAVNVSSD
jgi:polar amino acid transport system substrate-binding protein